MSADRQKYYMDQWKQQQEYHSKKAKDFKQRHQLLQTIIVVGALVVPIALNMDGISPFIPTAISLVVALATGLENVYRYGEQWVTFRRTSEMLKREQRMYIARAEAYTGANPFDVFVQRVEGILGEQNQTFVQTQIGDRSSGNRNNMPIPPSGG